MKRIAGAAFLLALSAIVLALTLGVMGPAMAQNTPTPPGYGVLGGQTTLAVSNSSANVALPAKVVPYGAITIYNKGATDAFVALGVDNTAAATTSSTLVVAGTDITIWAGPANTYLAAITASSSTNLVVYQATGPVQFGGGAAGAGSGGAVTVADGANVVEGATTDAAATAGSTGTLSAKLRLLTTQLASPVTTQPAGWSFRNITTSTTTTVKSGAGVLHIVNVNAEGTVASTVTAYDSLTGSGTKIATINSLTLSGPNSYDIAFSNGLTIVTTGAPDITVSYR